VFIIFFDIKGIVHKEFVLVSQTVNSAYFCGVLRRLREYVQRLRPELWGQKNWLLYHNAPFHTSFYTWEFFYQNLHDCRPNPSYFSVSSIEDKTERPPFCPTEFIEAESQAVLNTLTEHIFQDALKKWQKYYVR
jgi:hypothetical protein